MTMTMILNVLVDSKELRSIVLSPYLLSPYLPKRNHDNDYDLTIVFDF